MDVKRKAILFGRNNWIVLLLFGLIGQIAWAVENMYFNVFVYETVSPSLEAVTLMVQLSGIAATLTTLFAGTLSDKLGNRRSLISFGYVIWGITVIIFGFMSPENTMSVFGVDAERAIPITLVLVIVGDCVMTFFGSSANDAAFNAWITDNTHSDYRGRVEGIISILPLIAMLIVAGGFGILVELIGYQLLFLGLGIVITASGVFGIFFIKDSEGLSGHGTFADIFYGFRPSVIKANSRFYLTLSVVLILGVATQIFMPYMIIYMKEYLGFSVLEYSAVFAVAIIFGAALNVWLGILSDKMDKAKLIYIAAAVYSIGLLLMYFMNFKSHIATLILFGVGGFVMISGNIFTSALTGSLVRDYTPVGEVGKLQGVRMVFSVLIPMLIGPMIGNAINRSMNIPLPENSGADVLTTQYIPAPEIFLTASLVILLCFAVIPFIVKLRKNESNSIKDKAS